MTPLEVDQSKVGFGIQPETALHVGGSEEIGVTASRYECSGYYALQTTGTVATPLTVEECTAYQGTLGTLSSDGGTLHTTDTACTGGTITGGKQVAQDSLSSVESVRKYSPHYRVQINQCSSYASRMGRTFYDNVGGASDRLIYCVVQGHRVDTQTSNALCQSNMGCLSIQNVYQGTTRTYTKPDGTTVPDRSLQKTGVQQRTSGAPSLSLTLEECREYADNTFPSGFIGEITDSSSYASGCIWVLNEQRAYYNTDQSTVSCSNNMRCVEAVLPETDMKSWCDEECAGSNSYWIDTTTSQCVCGSEEAATCTKLSTDFVDLYSGAPLKPSGCFIKDNIVYHNPDAGGDCSQDSACIRKAECFAESIASTTVAVGMISEDKAWFKNGIIVSSDGRIKKNIVEVPNNQALDQLRQIPIKFYEYVDSSRGDKTIQLKLQNHGKTNNK